MRGTHADAKGCGKIDIFKSRQKQWLVKAFASKPAQYPPKEKSTREEIFHYFSQSDPYIYCFFFMIRRGRDKNVAFYSNFVQDKTMTARLGFFATRCLWRDAPYDRFIVLYVFHNSLIPSLMGVLVRMPCVCHVCACIPLLGPTPKSSLGQCFGIVRCISVVW